jgi:hypothetical protein
MKLVYLVILSVPIIMTILVFPEHINNPGLSKGTDVTLRQIPDRLSVTAVKSEQIGF